MDKLNIPIADSRYIESLRELIRTGVMAAPGLESSPLIDLPIVTQQCETNASAAKRAFVFIRVLQQIIKKRLTGKDAETASILFGFEGYGGVPIQDRYRAVAKLYSPHWTWENYRKEPLTRHLLAVYLALKREAELHSLPQTLVSGEQPRQARRGLVGQDWILERFDGLFSFPNQSGQPIESVQVRRLRAVCDKISTYRHYAWVRERGVSALPELSLLGPGKVTVTQSRVDADLRFYVTEVTFDKPVLFGESIEFTLVKRINTKAGYIVPANRWDWYGLVSLGSPAESVRIGVRLPKNQRPRAVVRYEDIISGLVKPSTVSSNKLAVDDSGFVSCLWQDVSAGYSYGIGIDWGEPVDKPKQLL